MFYLSLWAYRFQFMIETLIALEQWWIVQNRPQLDNLIAKEQVGVERG